jgi:hypothetical protein
MIDLAVAVIGLEKPTFKSIVLDESEQSNDKTRYQATF